MISCIRSKVRSTVDLPQPDGPDEGGDLVRLDVDVHIFHGQKVAVVDVLVVDVNTLSHDVSLYFLVFLRLRLSDWLSVRS